MCRIPWKAIRSVSVETIEPCEITAIFYYSMFLIFVDTLLYFIPLILMELQEHSNHPDRHPDSQPDSQTAIK